MSAACQEPPPPAPPGADLMRAWQLERWLAVARTPNVPLCLLLLPLVPGVSWPGTLLLAGLLAVGDAGAIAFLRCTPRPRRLRAVRALATALEWAGALGVIALCAPFPSVPVPTLLLLALALTTGRHGLRGLLGGTALAGLAILALMIAQAGPLGVRDGTAAGRAGLGWGALVVAVALSLGAFLGFAARWPTRGADPVPPPPDTTPVVPTPIRPSLSPRERQVLGLLARETDGELALKEIAHELGISRNTVKTHAVHLARKLGAADTSRPAILQAARRQGELPPPGPPAARPGGSDEGPSRRNAG